MNIEVKRDEFKLENKGFNDPQLPFWRKPVLIRIELQRTLFAGGQYLDGEEGTVET